MFFSASYGRSSRCSYSYGAYVRTSLQILIKKHIENADTVLITNTNIINTDQH